MALFETVLVSDLKKPVQVKALSGNLFSQDNQGNKITVEVMDGGSPASITGNVTGYIIREDNATVVTNGSLVGNKASIILPASAYIVVGKVSIVIKVGTVTVGACVANVYRTTTDELVDPGHVVPSIAELLEKIADCEAATVSANNAANLANTKAELADQKAQLADQKATLANTAAQNANDAADKIDDMTVTISAGDPTIPPTVVLTLVDGHYVLSFSNMKGNKGKDFHIAKTFSSISAMESYTGTDIEAYDFAMIDTGSVEDPDTGKLYCYEPENTPKWRYIGDLSGAQGIKGEPGTGITSIVLNQDYTLTITFTDGNSTTTGSIRGATGATPNISIGTVQTGLPTSPASVTITGTPENPVLNFSIPKGDPGDIENAYGSTIPMSPTDSTKIETAVNAKLNKNQGVANVGKVMTVSSTGEAIPDDLPPCGVSSATMNGESISPSATGNLNLGSVIRPSYDEVEPYTFIDAPSPLYGAHIWSDGNDIYYDAGNQHYMLDTATHTWVINTRGFSSIINGFDVWTDGEHIYYSDDSRQYELNKSTYTWSNKTWNVTIYSGLGVWTDGENVYYSANENQYVLDKSTATWNTKTWQGLTSFSGSDIWTDGENIYYSRGNNQHYFLDKSTSTWYTKNWNGETSFSGSSIWTDGENIYSSYYNSSMDHSVQYILDKDTSTWSVKTWSGFKNIQGSAVWTDGDNIYFSETTSYKIDTHKKLIVGENGVFSPRNVVDLIYPVGSIYMSVSSASPSALFGGTWEQLKDRFLLGAGDTYTAGDTGGAANVSYTPAGTNTGGEVSSHTLTVDEIPAHNHSFTGSAVTSGGISANHTHSGTSGNQSAGHTHSGPSHSHSVGTWDCKGYDSTKGSFKAVAQNSGWLANTTNSAGTGATGGISANHTHTTTTGNQSTGHSHSVTASGSIGNKGGGGGHSHGFTQPTFTGTAATINTMPPYLSVYMWKRTA